MKQPPQCFEAGCPLAGKGQGFALPSGSLESRIGLLLETPAIEEIQYAISSLDDTVDELDRRGCIYPHLSRDYVVRGAPVVGRAGFELFSWALKAAGLTRRDLYIGNVLQCYPGKKEDGTVNYPTGDMRKAAEGICSSLWWKMVDFKPEYSIINFHPAAIIRDVTPLPIQIAVFVKAKRLAQRGKVLVCCGGKAAKAWFGYGENVTRWAGHWQRETQMTERLRRERLK